MQYGFNEGQAARPTSAPRTGVSSANRMAPVHRCKSRASRLILKLRRAGPTWACHRASTSDRGSGLASFGVTIRSGGRHASSFGRRVRRAGV